MLFAAIHVGTVRVRDPAQRRLGAEHMTVASWRRLMPEFEGVSETLSVQEALEAAVRKAYTAYQRRTHTEPLFSYVVKRISGHLRTVTVVIETIVEEKQEEKPTTPTTAADRGPITTTDPIKELLDQAPPSGTSHAQRAGLDRAPAGSEQGGLIRHLPVWGCAAVRGCPADY
jgi:hypothetical protein